ncbi:uncharacterized protein TNCV_3027281 [Trichonephila clavipes]|nr:uncharacterized protein TNCV_3027281 [Trichonephila clavipes]
MDDSVIHPLSSKPTSQSLRLPTRRKSHDDILSASDGQGSQHSSRLQRSRSSSVKNLHRGGRPTSWSTPASPYYQGSRNLFVRITSPVVCAKLQTFPKAKMRLPPKDMKILEVILQKYEKMEEEEERKARAQRRWDREKELREKKKEEAEMERWKNFALKQKRSSSEEHLKSLSDKSTPTHFCSRYSAVEKENSERSSVFQKRHSFKFGLAIHQNDHQARRRFVEWAQNEIAVVPDFHKRILFSDEVHFWLNGYVNKQNCRIWSEANP